MAYLSRRNGYGGTIYNPIIPRHALPLARQVDQHLTPTNSNLPRDVLLRQICHLLFNALSIKKHINTPLFVASPILRADIIILMRQALISPNNQPSPHVNHLFQLFYQIESSYIL